MLLFFFLSCSSLNNETGKSYKGWKKGELDIHHIYTGRGESSFFILPDGTTLLIDAGDWDPDKEEYPLARIIARFIKTRRRVDCAIY